MAITRVTASISGYWGLIDNRWPVIWVPLYVHEVTPKVNNVKSYLFAAVKEFLYYDLNQ